MGATRHDCIPYESTDLLLRCVRCSKLSMSHLFVNVSSIKFVESVCRAASVTEWRCVGERMRYYTRSIWNCIYWWTNRHAMGLYSGNSLFARVEMVKQIISNCKFFINTIPKGTNWNYNKCKWLSEEKYLRSISLIW